MALLPCPECGREISTRAASCPQCGCPVAETVVAQARRAGLPPAVVRELLPAPPAQAPLAPGLGLCARCGSGDLRAVPLVYEEGTHRVNTRSQTSAGGIVGGSLAVGGATTVTSGVRQGMLAARLTPPVARPDVAVGKLVAAAALGVVALIIGGNIGGAVGLFVAGVVVTLGVGGASLSDVFRDPDATRWNTRDLPRALAAWRRSVLCMRRGAVTDLTAAR